MLSSLAPARRRLVLTVATITSSAVIVALVIAAVVALRPDKHATPVSQATPGPVLLVPGFGGSTTGLDALAAVLRRHGKDAQVLRLPGDGRGDLDAQARVLGTAVTAALARTHATSVDVIGYSAGGVVARLWVRDHGGASQARRVLTLGSPQHGTSQAELGRDLAGGCPVACEQLVPDSDLLRRLNARDETPNGPLWITLRSTADQVVTPVGSAALDGALNLVVQDYCPQARTAHGDLPSDPVTLATLRSVLGAGPPQPPAAGC